MDHLITHTRLMMTNNRKDVRKGLAPELHYVNGALVERPRIA